jgi:hypothetical protein
MLMYPSIPAATGQKFSEIPLWLKLVRARKESS